MIELIGESRDDLNMYYSDTCLIDVSNPSSPWPVICQRFESRHEAEVYDGEENHMVQRTDLRVVFFPASYNTRGELKGVNVQRSYKRAPQYGSLELPMLRTLLAGGLVNTFDGTRGVIGSKFLCSPYKVGASLVTYLSDYAGILDVQNKKFYIHDNNLADRLTNLLKGTVYEVA